MERKRYNLIVIGSGPGGYVAAIRASQLGMSVAVVERSELGGVCLNWGCIPTKAMLKSAQVFNYTQHITDYGVDISGNVTADICKIVDRSRAIAAGMSKGVEYLLKKSAIALIYGTGKIVSAGEVEVTTIEGCVSQFEADHIVIATGARANSLPFAPIDGKKVISYRQALVPEKLPVSMAVIGSGAIGSEFAYFYSSMGVDVCLIEYMGNIVPLEDEEVSAQLSRSFRKMGIKVMVSANVKDVDTSGGLCRLRVETKKGEQIVEVEQILSAVGVVANIENIGLEEVGVVVERGKIKVDKHYMTSVENIYAIGDVIATPALAHVASAEGILCVENIAGLSSRTINYSNIPACTYTSPEIASTGMTERAAKEAGIEYVVGKFPFTASGKASAAGERDGFVKLIIDKHSDEILGAHLMGANVTEIVGGLVMARNIGVKAKDIIRSIYPHPTMSEAVMEAASASHNEVIHI